MVTQERREVELEMREIKRSLESGEVGAQWKGINALEKGEREEKEQDSGRGSGTEIGEDGAG